MLLYRPIRTSYTRVLNVSFCWFAAGLLCFVTLPAMSSAARIELACRASERSAANPLVCSCIQEIADQVLTEKDQVLAATFFEDPHQAQVIRMSPKKRHDAFWDRYKEFGKTAVSACK